MIGLQTVSVRIPALLSIRVFQLPITIIKRRVALVRGVPDCNADKTAEGYRRFPRRRPATSVPSNTRTGTRNRRRTPARAEPCFEGREILLNFDEGCGCF